MKSLMTTFPADAFRGVVSTESTACFLRFCAVGGSGVLVDMGVLWLIFDESGASWLGSPLVAKALSAQAAIINNMIWNELWTFRRLAAGARGCRRLAARFFRFEALCLAGAGIGSAVIWLCYSKLGWTMTAANLTAISGAVGWNFLMSRRFAWKASGS